MAKSVSLPETDELPVEAEEVATHQEAIPLPYLAGTRKIAGRWISGARNMIALQSANPTPSKK